MNLHRCIPKALAVAQVAAAAAVTAAAAADAQATLLGAAPESSRQQKLARKVRNMQARP